MCTSAAISAKTILSESKTINDPLAYCVIKALGNTFAAAKLSDAGLAAQTVQNDADFLIGRMAFAGSPSSGGWQAGRRNRVKQSEV